MSQCSFSAPASSHMGNLEKVKNSPNFSHYSVGGMKSLLLHSHLTILTSFSLALSDSFVGISSDRQAF